MLQRAPITAINHLLNDAPWARERLKPFAGQVVAIDIAPLVLQLEVATDGSVCAPTGDHAASVDITVPLASLPLVVQGVEALFRQVRISGNAEMAEAIGFVARNLRWDAEEDLARWVGDIAAHRLATTARAFLDWQKNTVISAAEGLSEYLTEERPLLMKPAPLKPFIDEVDDLRDAIARLEKRVDKLAR